MTIEDPLAPGAPLDSLSADYRAEAVRWMQFHAGSTKVPGIHAPFEDADMKEYLQYRAMTNRNVTGILCKLKKMGEACGFVLCTSRNQQPSLQYQRLQTVKADLKKTRRLAGLDSATNEALATGNFSENMLLSSFDVRSARRFGNIHPQQREFIVIDVMKHTGCMRFGLFRDTDPLREDLIYIAQDDAYALRTTWRKTNKSNRPYTIKFPCRPPANSPARYVLPGARGNTYVSAGKIIAWYLQVTGLEHKRGDHLLFPHLALIMDRRNAYTRWLRKVYTAILPPGSTIPSRIRPHSGRAGWATDRARQNTNKHTIMMEGRWNDPRAMSKYIRTSLRDLLTSSRHRMIPEDAKKEPVVVRKF